MPPLPLVHAPRIDRSALSPADEAELAAWTSRAGCVVAACLGVVAAVFHLLG